ncbi:MAG: hypothetical protein E6G66_05155 [Actinobacteria bacterium]|nr:MAG: hypothetical protein E6G66_05155 [Actinomycetota bacterium]
MTLDEVLRQRGVPARDCRDCAKFDADPEGRGFGWCQAHDMYVKLYHPDGNWHSQCQFKAIRLVRELGRARPSPEAV